MDTRSAAVVVCFCALWMSVRSQSCEQSHAERCLNQLQKFSDRPELDFADSLSDLKTECVQAQASLACLKRYSKKCLSDEDQPRFHEGISGPKKLTLALCSEENELRGKYLSNLPCMRNMSEGFRYCRDKYERNQRDIAGVEYEDKIQLQCCSFEGYRRCLRILTNAQTNCVEDEPIGDLVDEIAMTVGGDLSSEACADRIERCTGSGSYHITPGTLSMFVFILTCLLFQLR